MLTLSATDFAIAAAAQAGTLKIERSNGRFGEFLAVSDGRGLIEVHNSEAECYKRLAEILGETR